MKDEKLYSWGSQKNSIFKGVVTKNQYQGGIAYKRELGQFADLKGGLARKRGWCFWGGRGLIYPSAYYGLVNVHLAQLPIQNFSYNLKGCSSNVIFLYDFDIFYFPTWILYFLSLWKLVPTSSTSIPVASYPQIRCH